MKRIVLFVSVMALAVSSVQAQVQVALGVRGGLNYARIDGHGTVTQNLGLRTGFHAGAYALIKIAKFGIQPEIIFSKQGQNFSYNTQSLASNYDYINIPIILKLYLIGGLNLQAGPQFGFLAGAKGDLINSNQSITTGQDLKNFVKKSDVSLGLGFGWDLPLGINLTARYNMGLTDVNPQTGQAAGTTVSSLGTASSRNRVFQLSIGYRIFKLGK